MSVLVRTTTLVRSQAAGNKHLSAILERAACGRSFSVSLRNKAGPIATRGTASSHKQRRNKLTLRLLWPVFHWTAGPSK
jgi:hypothetical protein